MLQPHLVIGSAFTFGDAFFTLFAFAILLVLIRIYAWKPLMGIMKEREEHIGSEIDAAEENRAQSEKLLAEQKSVLQQARVESQTMIENAKQLGEKEREEIVKTARRESERIKEEAKSDIAREKKMLFLLFANKSVPYLFLLHRKSSKKIWMKKNNLTLSKIISKG